MAQDGVYDILVSYTVTKGGVYGFLSDTEEPGGTTDRLYDSLSGENLMNLMKEKTVVTWEQT